MPLWLILGIALAVLTYGSLAAFFIGSFRANRRREREQLRDPYETRERRARVRRALQREGIFTTDHKGRERLGL